MAKLGSYILPQGSSAPVYYAHTPTRVSFNFPALFDMNILGVALMKCTVSDNWLSNYANYHLLWSL